MATQILAAGTTLAVSSTITLAAGESVTLLLKGGTGKQRPPLRAHVAIQAQDSGGAWRHHSDMRGTNGTAVLTAVGTFRCVRPVQDCEVGVDRG